MNNMNEVKSPKKPVLMYYVIIFLLVILFNSAVMPAWREQQVKEVDYSTFMNLTDEKKIRSSLRKRATRSRLTRQLS